MNAARIIRKKCLYVSTIIFVIISISLKMQKISLSYVRKQLVHEGPLEHSGKTQNLTFNSIDIFLSLFFLIVIEGFLQVATSIYIIWKHQSSLDSKNKRWLIIIYIFTLDIVIMKNKSVLYTNNNLFCCTVRKYQT